MSQFHPSMEPEYILEESEKIHPMENKLACINLNYSQVEVELVQLLGAVKLSIDLSEKIQDSLHVLVQSLQERQ